MESATTPSCWRENAPLYGVALILALVFATLAFTGGEAEQQPITIGSTEGIPAPASAPALAALPATGGAEAVIASQLDPDSARARNAAVPLAGGTLSPAPWFRFAGSGLDRSRARDCLALAAMAEAGGGDEDQRAVIQVILNRVRHPAFAKTVCGVVYEGSQRPTGCQFSFTCDGSLNRSYSSAAWTAARRRAEEALGGRVYAPVGNATHYHADYVYPWWSPQLVKLAQVGPHLFFRWDGFWGSAKALSARYAGGEPDPLALTATAIAVERPEGLVPSFAESGTPLRTITAPLAVAIDGPAPRPATPDAPAPGVHFVVVSAGDAPAALIERARALCPGTAYCQVYGWADPGQIPARLPLPAAARAALAFSYRAGRGGTADAIFFDCRSYTAPTIGSCLPRPRG